MRDYGRVYSSFWQSPEMRALPEDARTLALYLLTSPHGNLIGCFRLPDAYAAEDLQWSIERVSEGFRKLLETDFLTRDEATKWLLIRKYMKWNSFENPNVSKAAHKALSQVPRLSLKPLLALAILEFNEHIVDELRKDCETLSKPYRKPEPEPEPIQSLTGTGTIAPSALPGKPARKRASKPAVDSAPTWEAYANAYQDRYSVKPVRNASVNAQIATFIAKLGVEEAPAVARFFVGHQNGLYVSAMHPANLLVRDAEKLRTEWATGRQVTRMNGMHADRTQTNLNAFAPLIAEARAKEAEDAQRSAA